MDKNEVVKFATAAALEADQMHAYQQMSTEERWVLAYTLACQYHNAKANTMSEGFDSKKVYKSSVPFV